MAKNLLIVESPAKAKTINKYLGTDFKVLASYGHVRDLVPKEGAVDPDHDFKMDYALIDKNVKHVDDIAKAARIAESIYLATDLDREGEAISWHISEILKERGLLKDKETHRVVFSEITPRAIRKPWRTRAGCRTTWSMPNRRAARWITWSVSTCRPCCGGRCSAGCRPGACNRRRSG
jgi:DNA topoisomerase-1